MKPLNRPRRLDELRVTRKSNIELIHKGESHGWAVSYADFLMVLLSFFVLFFSLDDNPGVVREQLQRIVLTMRGEPVGELSSAAKFAGSNRDPQSLVGLFNIEGMRVTPHPEYIVVDLEQSSYGPGEYFINEGLEKQISFFVEKVRPFKDDLMLTVIGHTDNVPLVRRHSLLKDNFDLSSIRALTVVRRIISDGIPANSISSRAASSYDRNSRSISFEIRIKEKKENKG